MRVRSLAVASVLMLLVAGCQDATESAGTTTPEVPQPRPAVVEADLGPPPEGQTEPPVDEAETSVADGALPAAEGDDPSPAETNVELTIASWDDVQAVVASQAGKIVVLDLWSTGCVPCLQEFPHLVRLHEQHGDAVACISVSTDYSGRASKPPETYRDKVHAFLVEQQAGFENFLCNEAPDELFGRLELDSIPAVFVYDRQGVLKQRFDNTTHASAEVSYERDVLPLVMEMLAEN